MVCLLPHLVTRKLAFAATLYAMDDAASQYVGRFVFKGKTKAVEVHQILGCGDRDREAWMTYNQYFSAAIAAFQAAKWTEAIEYFESVKTIRPNDPPTRWYLQLTEDYRRSPPPNFDGTIILTAKRPGE